MKNSKIISIVIGILFIGGLGVLMFNRRGGSRSVSLVSGPEASSTPSYFTPVSGSSDGSGENTAASVLEQSNPAGGVSSSGNLSSGSQAASRRADLNKTYSNAEFGLSFNYPDVFNVSGFAEGETGYTILAQKPNSKESFQIFVTDFDEPAFVETSAGKAMALTPERIKQDLPDMKIENPTAVLVGSNKKINALIFFSQNESLGRTREVWFIHSGKLYQLSTYADMDSLIGPVLETLVFK